VVGVAKVVEPIGGDEVAGGVVAVAKHRRVDVAERPDVLLAALEDAVARRVNLDDLLPVVVVVLDRGADDPFGPPALTVVLVFDGRGAVVPSLSRTYFATPAQSSNPPLEGGKRPRSSSPQPSSVSLFRDGMILGPVVPALFILADELLSLRKVFCRFRPAIFL